MIKSKKTKTASKGKLVHIAPVGVNPLRVGMTLGNGDDPEYRAYRARVQARFIENLQLGGGVLFTTDTPLLWKKYLSGFAAADRQHHNCNACRHFIEHYGGLVVIDAEGNTRSAIWNGLDADEEHRGAVLALARYVNKAKVIGVFLSEELVWGKPTTGDWAHVAVTPPSSFLHKRTALQTAGQKMAERRQDYEQVQRALNEFRPTTVACAMDILKGDALYRAEHVLGPAKFLSDLHTAIAANDVTRRGNIVWRAIALAPPGFCHPRSSMVGTILEDLASDMDFATVKARFAKKMHPLQYQRPTAPPTTNAIREAEKLVETLGVAPSLERRFARIDEILAVWRLTGPLPASPGVFGHLHRSTQPAAQIIPGGSITWEKFVRTVLLRDEVVSMKVQVPTHGNFAALITATHQDAPPILQWDHDGRRNPVSWYLYNGGSPASRWCLNTGYSRDWAQVNAVTLQPSMWQPGYDHQGKGVLFVIAGCRDSAHKGSGLALFPEILKSELREIRSVIEAHSRTRNITGYESASACGLLGGGGAQAKMDIRVRVTSRSGVVMEYHLDRWD